MSDKQTNHVVVVVSCFLYWTLIFVVAVVILWWSYTVIPCRLGLFTFSASTLRSSNLINALIIFRWLFFSCSPRYAYYINTIRCCYHSHQPNTPLAHSHTPLSRWIACAFCDELASMAESKRKKKSKEATCYSQRNAHFFDYNSRAVRGKTLVAPLCDRQNRKWQQNYRSWPNSTLAIVNIVQPLKIFFAQLSSFGDWAPAHCQRLPRQSCLFLTIIQIRYALRSNANAPNAKQTQQNSNSLYRTSFIEML